MTFTALSSQQKPHTHKRLALDVGTTSIGWALLGTDADGECQSVIKTGVRIFDNGREDKSDAPWRVFFVPLV